MGWSNSLKAELTKNHVQRLNFGPSFMLTLLMELTAVAGSAADPGSGPGVQEV